MRLKSYFSGTVEAAMALARKEMGDDAMLIHSRPAQPEARHLGAYEVVFGTYAIAPSDSENRQDAIERSLAEPSAAGSRKERPGPVAVAKRLEVGREEAVPRQEAKPGEDPLSQQVSQLRREMERMIESLVLQSQARQTSSVSPGVAEEEPELLEPLPSEARKSEDSIYQWLVEQEVDPVLARAAAQGKPLEDTFQTNSVLGREDSSDSGSKRAIVALIGPPGAGKTTTLAKLAARYGLGGRKRAHILSADVLRIGAADQLRTLASL
jgi:flagellar biosynthesis protein FlhF